MKNDSRRYRAAILQRVRKIYVAEFFEAIVAAFVIAILLRVFVVSVYRVPTESMMPSLIPGDFIVGFKTSYGLKIPFVEEKIGARDPNRGDVVIFQPTEEGLYVKRVVGVPGDHIEIRDGALLVNESIVTFPREKSGEWEILEESFGGSTHRVMRRMHGEQTDFLAPQVVPPGHVFLLGDLRSESVDSRHWGAIPIDQIEARASFIGMSLRIQGQGDLVEIPTGLSARAEIVPEGRIRLGRTFKVIE